MSAIVLSHLTRNFADTAAVNDISFTVGKGELFGLVGPDGAGKTTTLRMLAGILRPTSGDASLNGVSVVDDPEGVKHSIAYMSQRFGLYTDLTVSENIQFYADLYGVPKDVRPERLETLYAFSNLGPFQDRLAGDLSGGMKQKLSLCCALIHRPEIMLLDEPTFGVDPISRRDLWLIIHQMVADGTTVMVSTAYMDEAERCDRVALLNHGEIISLDSPVTIQRSIPDVVSVRTDDPRRTRDVLREAEFVTSANLFGESVHVSTADTPNWPAIEKVLFAAELEVLEHEIKTPSLEDVFIRLVEESDNS